MKIKSYNQFKINESVEIEDEKFIRDVFLEYTDMEFTLFLENVFFNAGLYRTTSLSDVYNRPGLYIELKNKAKNEVKVDNISNMLSGIDECVDRLSDLGEVVINKFNYNRETIEIQFFLLYTEKQVELSEKEGFYDFHDKIKDMWRTQYNKTTKSFDYHQVKDEIILTPKDGVDVAKMLPEVKTQLKKFFDPWYFNSRRRLSHEYTYDVKLIDNKIHLIYKERFRINAMGRRI